MRGSTSNISPALAARLGPPVSGSEVARGGEGGRGGAGTASQQRRGGSDVATSGSEAARTNAARGGSDYSRLRGIIRTQKDTIQNLETEVLHFQSRLHRVEDGHKLELARLRKEVEYHKRLRQGADQRSYELEARLEKLQQGGTGAGAGSGAEGGDTAAQDSQMLQTQLQVLVQKNSELANKLKTFEGQVVQLEELKAALECELDQAYGERDALAEELEHLLAAHHASTYGALRPTEDGDDDVSGPDAGGADVSGGVTDGDGGALGAAGGEEQQGGAVGGEEGGEGPEAQGAS